jgi:type IV secretory pathway VirB2 component (pilin)
MVYIHSMGKCITIIYYITLIVLYAAPETVEAANPIGQTLCAVVGWFKGSVGAGLATLSIFIIGIAAMMGKISWGMCIFAQLDVVLLFGAGALVEELGGVQCVQ